MELQIYFEIIFKNINHTDKKENKIFLIFKEIKRDRVQSHIWLTASSYIGKNMTLHPIQSEFPNIWGNFFFYLWCTAGVEQIFTLIWLSL